MVFNEEVNQYIKLSRDDADIMSELKQMQEYAGKWGEYFGNSNDICLEIGTGMGNFFSDECSANPDKNYIGMDIRYKRVYNAAEKSRKKWASNFVILKEFAQKIDTVFVPGEISEVYVFFPDPWARKDRQKKNRLFQTEFIELLEKIIRSWWKLIFKTDHREYFDSTLELFAENSNFEIIKQSYDYENELDVFDKQNMTEFEHMFRWKKIDINYVEYRRK